MSSSPFATRSCCRSPSSIAASFSRTIRRRSSSRTFRPAASATSSAKNGAKQSCSTWFIPMRLLQTTPQVVQQNLRLTPEEFDKQYLAWIDNQYGSEAAHFDEWREKLKGTRRSGGAEAVRRRSCTGPCSTGAVSRICRRRQRLRVDGRCGQGQRRHEIRSRDPHRL